MHNLRLALLGLAAIAALLLGAGFLERAFHVDKTDEAVEEPAAPSASATSGLSPEVNAARQKIEANIAQSPDYIRLFDRLRLVFPGEYVMILNTLAQSSIAVNKEATPDGIVADAVASLRKSEGGLAAKASNAALAQIFVMQLTEMRALAQRDVHLCVAFLYGVNGPGFLNFAAEHRGLVADAAIAGIDAMSSGRTERIQRGTPSDGDFQILDKALTEKGLARPEIEALLDGKSANPPIADDRMCVAGQTYLETLGGLDPDVRGRLYGLAVDLMAKS